MLSYLHTLIRRRAFVLALLLVGGLTGTAGAETVYIVNKTSISVVVQGATVVRGVPRQDRQILLAPDESTPSGITLAGNKGVTIFDPKNANRVLYQGALPNCDTDQHYALVQDGPNRYRLVRQR